MRKSSLLLLCTGFVVAGLLSFTSKTLEKEYPEPEQKELIFFDDFAGATVDWNTWRIEEQSNPNWKLFLSNDPAGVEIKDGNVILRAIWENGHPKTWGISTYGKVSFTYGEVQVRAKFPRTGKGAWPAIWLMPQNQVYPDWPNCGEIDIMERINDAPVIYHAYHIKNKSGEGRVGPDIVDFEGYNIYSLKKYPDRLEYYINGINTYTLRRDEILPEVWPFDTDWYLILNHACADDGREGATWWPELVDDPTQLPYEMAVDWVKIYRY